MEEGGTREAKLTDSLEAADRHLSTQIKALEILTNLCCPADSDSLGDDEFYDSCSEGSVDGVGIEESTLELNPQLKEAFLRAGLFETVVSRARLPAENIIEALFQHSSGKFCICRGVRCFSIYLLFCMTQPTRQSIAEEVRDVAVQSVSLLV